MKTIGYTIPLENPIDMKPPKNAGGNKPPKNTGGNKPPKNTGGNKPPKNTGTAPTLPQNENDGESISGDKGDSNE
jgi:hypothetical protein